LCVNKPVTAPVMFGPPCKSLLSSSWLNWAQSWRISNYEQSPSNQRNTKQSGWNSNASEVTPVRHFETQTKHQ